MMEKLRVMIVDDPDVAEMLIAVDSHGFDVRFVMSEENALALASVFQPHVAVVSLVDTTAPDRLPRTLRSVPGLERVRVIAMADADTVASDTRGFDHYLAKPVQLAPLVRAILAAHYPIGLH